MENRLHLPTVIDNNVRALALAESALQDYNQDLVFVKYGPGIGASMIIQNEVYSGATHNALEFGHAIIEVDGKLCRCGQKGCLETIGSINHIMEEIQHRFQETSKLKMICNDQLYDLCIENIIDAYLQKDPIIIEIMERTLDYFAIGLVNLIKIIDTKAVAIYSPLFKTEVLYQLLRTKIAHYNQEYPRRMRRSMIGSNMSIGALHLVRKELLYDTGATIRREQV
jgi:predicted NBD/HSP70 family sugar kinase